MQVEVQIHVAFATNCVGSPGNPFPLSFSVRESAGCFSVQATAARASELADLLIPAGVDTVLVADLHTNSWLTNDIKPWTPAGIAAIRATPCTVHDFSGLATMGLSAEGLVMTPASLLQLLDGGWTPYQTTVVGMPGSPSADRLDEIGLALGTARHDRPILPTLPGCTLHYTGHDDCYVTVESTDPAVAPAVLGRLLALLVGSPLTEEEPVVVQHPPDVMIAALLAESPDWIGHLAGDHTVHLAVTTGPWRLADPIPDRVDRVAVYSPTDGTWHLT
ncbi:hypothetical protein [Actinoplanes palleronii]|uniref:Uncharacterized protein n=1 Tax=Actinoplanes palleronii TaxID=113570 RepID=A0ABQ4BSZ5_9ACTN|nr:hypothetical protein [Actinoplanes palleronii]GIE73391.1 hypothetical protein Apa02nite_094990 [Actinoplanes palleronii]